MLRTSKLGYLRGVAAENDLVAAAGLEALDLHAVVLALEFQKGTVVGDGGIGQRSRVIVIGPTAIEHELDGDERAHFGYAGEFVAAGSGLGVARGAAHVVVVEVCQVAVVERGRGFVGEHVADVAGDPFARCAGSVGFGGRTAWREVAAVAGVEQHAGAVGEDEQGGVATAGIDLMDVQGSGSPGRQGLAGLLGEGGDGEQEGKESHVWTVYRERFRYVPRPVLLSP